MLFIFSLIHLHIFAYMHIIICVRITGVNTSFMRNDSETGD